MKYNRRPNRPDANVYREMRRRGMGRGHGGASMSPKALLATAAVLIALVAWAIWK